MENIREKFLEKYCVLHTCHYELEEPLDAPEWHIIDEMVKGSFQPIKAVYMACLIGLEDSDNIQYDYEKAFYGEHPQRKNLKVFIDSIDAVRYFFIDLLKDVENGDKWLEGFSNLQSKVMSDHFYLDMDSETVEFVDKDYFG